MNIVFVLRLIGGILAGIGAFQVMSNLVDLPARTTLDLWVVYAVVSASFGIGYLVSLRHTDELAVVAVPRTR